MLSEWELWACANRVLQTHGEEAALHAAEQIGALVLQGDAEGVRTGRRSPPASRNFPQPAGKHRPLTG